MQEKDVVSVRETVSITPSYTSTAKDIRHEVTKVFYLILQ